MSQAIVEAVRVKYPTPLGAIHGAFLIELAQTLGGGAGLLKKDGGTNILLPDGQRVAQDIICYPNGRIFDCLGDGEGEAIPQWSEANGSPVDPSRYYAVSGTPVPPPTPEPPAPQPPPVVCNAVAASAEVLDAIHELRMENLRLHEDEMVLLSRIEGLLRERRAVELYSWRTGTIRGHVEGAGER